MFVNVKICFLAGVNLHSQNIHTKELRNKDKTHAFYYEREVTHYIKTFNIMYKHTYIYIIGL